MISSLYPPCTTGSPLARLIKNEFTTKTTSLCCLYSCSEGANVWFVYYRGVRINRGVRIIKVFVLYLTGFLTFLYQAFNWFFYFSVPGI
jgi:hypothetical protein